MLVDESTKISKDLERQTFQDRVTREGMELWRKQKEFEKQKKLKEQNEVSFLNFNNYYKFSALWKLLETYARF